MKVQFRSILFALVVPVAACGGDREPQAVTTQLQSIQVGTEGARAGDHADVAVGQLPKVVEVNAPLPTKYDEALAKGRELIAKGSYGDAKEMLESAIMLDKKKAEPHIEMARLYIATARRESRSRRRSKRSSSRRCRAKRGTRRVAPSSTRITTTTRSRRSRRRSSSTRTTCSRGTTSVTPSCCSRSTRMRPSTWPRRRAKRRAGLHVQQPRYRARASR